jgi:hypothetical protein
VPFYRHGLIDRKPAIFGHHCGLSGYHYFLAAGA